MQIKTREFSVNAISYETAIIIPIYLFSFFYDNVIAIRCTRLMNNEYITRNVKIYYARF